MQKNRLSNNKKSDENEDRDNINKITSVDDSRYLKYKKIDKFFYISSLLYLIIPIVILLAFWFKMYISVFAILALLISFFIVVKNFKYKKYDEYKKIFNYKKILILFLLIIIINILSGSGGISLQNWDYKFRNSVLHDLIDNNWPVKYDYSNLKTESEMIGSNSGILSYYFAYWIPSAIVGKLFGFSIASVFLLLWQILGTSLFFYLICRKMNNIKLYYFIVFICFSGMDIIGMIILNVHKGIWTFPLGTIHIDTWNGLFCMSSFITQLFWVFNQSVPAWLVTSLLLNAEENYENYGFLIALLLPFSPFPTIGLILFMLLFMIHNIYKKCIPLKKLIIKLFSFQNILSMLSVVPIGLLFMQNSSEKGFIIARDLLNINLKDIMVMYILFILFEILQYVVIITKNNKYIIAICYISFALLPLFYIGSSVDLGNRATIPALIIYYFEILKFIRDNKSKIRLSLLILALLITACTNFNEIYRGIKYIVTYKKSIYLNFEDSNKTFSRCTGDESKIFFKNFVAPNKNNYFVKYILK